MSDIVHYRGKLVEIKPRRSRTIQEIAKDLIDKHGIEESDYWRKYHTDDYVHLLQSERFEYVSHDDKLYEIISKIKLDAEDDIIRVEKNVDGTLDFEMRYYNGGGSLQEAIGSGLTKLKKNN